MDSIPKKILIQNLNKLGYTKNEFSEKELLFESNENNTKKQTLIIYEETEEIVKYIEINYIIEKFTIESPLTFKEIQTISNYINSTER